MSIATLAQGARQSLARGLEALQARDAPLGLLDVAEPVARAISGLVDLELEPLEASPARVEPVLDALRESLQLLQAPEFVEHPAAARGMKGVAEALAVVVTLARRAREGKQSGNGALAAGGSFARAPLENAGVVHTPASAPGTPAPAPAASDAVAATPAASTPAAATPATTAPALAAPPAVVASPTVVASPVVPAPAPAAAPPAVAAPVASAPAPSMRPSLRSLAPSAESNEAAVITRAVNAVMGPAPASIVDSTPAAGLPAPASVHVDAAPAPRVEPQPVRVEPQPARIESQPVRIEPQLARAEPSIALRDPEPPPLITSRPAEAVDAPPPQRAPDAPAPQRTPDVRTSTPSRAPVSIRRDVIVERDLRAVDAPLGAHSASNFYTGLAGGDVVASGGLFVATYQVPKLGEKVLLKISMPGGYEFLAKAKVAWTRDITGSLGAGSMRGVQSAPGFGAQFCEITEEGRRLIQRYVRNREPLFHEDSP